MPFKDYYRTMLIWTLIIFSFSAVSVQAGKISNKPGRTDNNLKDFLKNKVNEVGDSTTVYNGDGSNLDGVGVPEQLKSILLMRDVFIPAPPFFNVTSHTNNGYAGQHVFVDNRIFVHERDSANGQSSRKFAEYDYLDGWIERSSSVNAFCEQGAYAIGPNEKNILFTRGACGGLASSTTEIYHIPSNTWFDTSATFPSEVIDGSSSDFGMNGKMPTYGDTSYYFGGFEASGKGNYAFAYDWSENTMERIQNLPDTWDQASASDVYTDVSGDTHSIFLHPGEINLSGNPSQEFWEYEIETDSYKKRREMPNVAQSIGGAFISNTGTNLLFVSSRPSGSGSDNLVIYDTMSNTWSTVNGATDGFTGMGLKQVSVSGFHHEIRTETGLVYKYIMINPTTNSDVTGYKLQSVIYDED